VLHLRVTSPPDRTGAVVELLENCPGLAHLAVLENATRRPAMGDLIIADIARESVDELVHDLRELGIDKDGGIAIENIDTAISAAAEKAEADAPGEGADAVIWEEVVRRVDKDSVLSWTYVVFLFLATTLAAIAVILDSSILVIGAMVVGPEFGPVAAIAVGLVHGRAGLLRSSFVTLVVGFVVAIIGTTLLCLLAWAVGWIGPEVFDGERPLTGFIWRPDKWSFVVAFMAGVAGVVSLTSSKSGALVGVFISVTTVPAAGDFALALALGNGREMGGSAAQLGVNLAAMLLAGVLTLLAQKLLRQPFQSIRERIPARASVSSADSPARLEENQP
jgi:uncharacterized hydrophobic protein (TIGR00271 family)